jgi:hypothetical protein
LRFDVGCGQCSSLSFSDDAITRKRDSPSRHCHRKALRTYTPSPRYRLPVTDGSAAICRRIVTTSSASMPSAAHQSA